MDRTISFLHSDTYSNKHCWRKSNKFNIYWYHHRFGLPVFLCNFLSHFPQFQTFHFLLQTPQASADDFASYFTEKFRVSWFAFPITLEGALFLSFLHRKGYFSVIPSFLSYLLYNTLTLPCPKQEFLFSIKHKTKEKQLKKISTLKLLPATILFLASSS